MPSNGSWITYKLLKNTLNNPRGLLTPYIYTPKILVYIHSTILSCTYTYVISKPLQNKFCYDALNNSIPFCDYDLLSIILKFSLILKPVYMTDHLNNHGNKSAICLRNREWTEPAIFVTKLLSNTTYPHFTMLAWQFSVYSWVLALFLDWIIRIGNSLSASTKIYQNDTCSSYCTQVWPTL